MAASEELKALVAKVPELDKKGARIPLLKTKPSDGKFTGPEWDEALKIIEPILKGGKASITGLVDLLEEVDDGRDYKARYLLHAMAQFVCRADKQEQQDMVIDALASSLTGRPAPIRKFVIQQIQVCGDKRVAAQLGRLLLDDDVYEEAALALLAIGDGAVEQFRAALPKARGKARLTCAQNLGVLKDAASAGVLREAVGGSDAALSAAAAWGLANLGDASAADAICKAADAAKSWQRIDYTKACFLLAERLLAAGKKADATKIYTHLRETRTGASESYVREAAAKALTEMK